jgi:hypothetical protein
MITNVYILLQLITNNNVIEMQVQMIFFYTFEQLKPHKVRFMFKGNVADKSIKTHTTTQ